MEPIEVARAPPPPPPRPPRPYPKAPPTKLPDSGATGMIVTPSRSTGSPMICRALALVWMLEARRSTKVWSVMRPDDNCGRLSIIDFRLSVVVPRAVIRDHPRHTGDLRKSKTENRSTTPQLVDDLALAGEAAFFLLREDRLAVDADDEDAAAAADELTVDAELLHQRGR